jgi:ABC-type lipoprotein release transport system permease subunit
VHSLLAGWRVSLHRTRADWPIVAAAWLSSLLAAALLSIGPIYSSAATLAGIRRALADASSADTSINAAYYAEPAQAAEVDQAVRAELQGAIDPLGGSVLGNAQSTNSFAIAGRNGGGAKPDRAVLGFADGLADHARLTDGAWPAEGREPGAPMQVVVLDTVAERLHVRVGSQLSLVLRNFGEESTLRTRIVGIFAIDAPADAYWQGDEQLASGVVDRGTYRMLGPLLTSSANVLGREDLDSIHMRWRAFPDLARLTAEESPNFRGRLQALPDRLRIAAAAELAVSSGLPAILATAERSLQVSGASVLLLMLQLAILAAYAIILTASLLVDHRQVDTAMLRSRGAGPWQLTLLSLGEALLLAVPAVLLAPWLAAGALTLLNVVGPLADVGLNIVPRVTSQAYLAAAAAGATCVVLMVLPVLIGARRFADAERQVSRQETRTFGHRMGLDIALVAISAIALWQLRAYGAPLTTSVRGNLGLDPLLVAAPAIGLLAGSVLALRILPFLAQAAERAIARWRALVPSLGVQQLARRPLRYTRSALLLMIAVSTGVFAISYADTWSTSQADQAAFQSGAAIRVVPDHSLGAPPSQALPAAYASLAGAGPMSPVERLDNGLAFGAASGDVLALDAATAASIVLLRPDQAPTTLGNLMSSLRASRPEPRLAILPDGARFLRVVPRLDFRRIQHLIYDGDFSDPRSEPVAPADLGEVRIVVSAIVRDGRGLMYEVDSPQETWSGAARAIVLPLAPGDAGLIGPLQLAELSVDVWLPLDHVVNDGYVGVARVAAAMDEQGPWTNVALADVGLWRATQTDPGQRQYLPADTSDGVAMALSGGGIQGVLFGNGFSGPPAHVVLMPDAVASLDAALPVIANRAFLAAANAKQGDTVTARLQGIPRDLVIAGTVEQFPGTATNRPVIVVDEPSLGLARLQATSAVRDADEWWFASPPAEASQLAAQLAGPPLGSREVVTAADRARTLGRDPVAIGILGALTLGFVAAALFAVVGLVVSAAVSARQRRAEFAVLRALGLSAGQLSRWLWLENGTVVAVSVLAGTGLGLLLGWLVLPFVTVTQQGTAPVPAVLVEVPWNRILLLDITGAVTLALAVAVIGMALRRIGVGGALRMGDD